MPSGALLPTARREPVGEVVRASDVADLAHSDEVVGAERLFERHAAVVEVQLVQVDEVGLQPAATARRSNP